MAKRPLGVTVICILGWIWTILSILGGVAFIAGGAITGIQLGYVFGILNIILGISILVVLYWLWQMKKQGWKWTMLLETVFLVLSLAQMNWNILMNWVGMIIPAIIVIYLWMNKKLFK